MRTDCVHALEGPRDGQRAAGPTDGGKTMTGPFDTDTMDETLALDDDAGDGGDAQSFEDGDQGDGFDHEAASADDADVDDPDPADDFEGESTVDLGDGFAQGVDDMAVWDAFEEEVADGLEAADTDEFFARLAGALGRAGGVVRRGTDRVAGAATTTAQAATRLAALLGQRAPVVATARSGRATTSAIAPLSRLFGQGLDDLDGFDMMADLFAEDGVDAALPAAVGLAARVAARALGSTAAQPLASGAARALVRGVGAAARALVGGRGPHALRALPRLVQAAARAAQRLATTPDRAAQIVRRRLPVAAANLMRNPRLMQRLEQPAAVTRPRRTRHPPVVSGSPAARPGRVRTYNLPGPITLTMVAPR